MPLVLSAAHVRRLVPMGDCIAQVERAFAQHARGFSAPAAVAAYPVASGGFHLKAAAFVGLDGRPVFAAKVNANFPSNPELYGLPTIQGVLALFDATNGRVLSLMDSSEVTCVRTAAATAVAAKYLAPEVAVVAIVGCGAQARHQMRALACVRHLARITAIDTNDDCARTFAADVATELGVETAVARVPADAPDDTNVWITCTPARRWLLGRDHVRPGSFVAAVGADNPEKQEIEPALMARSAVVADVLDQCVVMGDLHHALASGAMRREDVRADLADVISGTGPGRLSATEIVIFDSTGTAIEDVAAAALAFERAHAAGVGLDVDFTGDAAAPTVRHGAGVPA